MLGCVSIVPGSLFLLLLSPVLQIPGGRIVLRIRLKKDLLETFSVLLVSLISFANESD